MMKALLGLVHEMTVVRGSANDLATHSTGDEGAMYTFVSTCDISELLYLIKDAMTFY